MLNTASPTIFFEKNQIIFYFYVRLVGVAFGAAPQYLQLQK
jgi:hypothetical protein